MKPEYADYVEKLKKYKLLKKQFAKKYGYPERIIQRAIDQFSAFVTSENGNTITTEQFLAMAEPIDSLYHDLFDWSAPSDSLTNEVNNLFDLLNYFLVTNNHVFKVTKIE